eukprot:scaffold1182_cov396-Prasinococcus_capsulatus_cf.AAC.17
MARTSARRKAASLPLPALLLLVLDALRWQLHQGLRVERSHGPEQSAHERSQRRRAKRRTATGGAYHVEAMGVLPVGVADAVGVHALLVCVVYEGQVAAPALGQEQA